MINLLGCLTALVIGLQLSKIESIGVREARILTYLGWLIALYCVKEGGL